MVKAITLIFFIIDVVLAVIYSLATAISIHSGVGNPWFSAGVALVFIILGAIKYSKLETEL